MSRFFFFFFSFFFSYDSSSFCFNSKDEGMLEETKEEAFPAPPPLVEEVRFGIIASFIFEEEEAEEEIGPRRSSGQFASIAKMIRSRKED